MYNFNKQLAKGEDSEAKLDTIFALDYIIERVNRDLQRKGIDRIFTRKRTGAVLKIEYKTDWTAAKTGNAFVETVSVDRENKPGWAYSSQADRLIYYIPGDELIYIIAFAILRAQLAAWKKYKTRSIPNDGYNTIGILVPLREFEHIAEQVLPI